MSNSKEINRYNFLLNSEYATPGPGTVSSSQSNYNLTNPIVLTKDNNYFLASITNSQIPFSFWIVHSPLNVVTGCTIQQGAGISTRFTITIPEGNYNIIQICQTWTTLLQAQMTLYNAASTSVLLMTYNDTNGFTTTSITADGGGGGVWTIFIPFKSSSIYSIFLGNMLGYQYDVTFTSPNSVVSRYRFNVGLIQNLYIRSSSLRSRNYEYLYTSGTQVPSNIIASVAIPTSYDSYLVGNLINPIESKLVNKTINNIDLTLFDDQDNVPLSLNGCYWSCNLLIREIEVDLPETVQNFSKDMKNENLNNFTQSTQPPPVASDETVQDAKEKMSKYTSALERIANPAETEPNPAEEPGIEEKEKLNKYVKALEQITENYEQVKDIASQ